MDKDKEHRHSLLSGLGRIHLQVNCDKTIHIGGGGMLQGSICFFVQWQLEHFSFYSPYYKVFCFLIGAYTIMNYYSSFLSLYMTTMALFYYVLVWKVCCCLQCMFYMISLVIFVDW